MRRPRQGAGSLQKEATASGGESSFKERTQTAAVKKRWVCILIFIKVCDVCENQIFLERW